MISKVFKLSVIKYLAFSCGASIIDFGMSYFLYGICSFNYIFACNIGILSGLLFQYFTSMKYVFKSENFINSFIIYMSTFIIGLILADGTIWVSYRIIHFSFLISKVFSMMVPFFITYFIRKKMLGLKTSNIMEGKNEDLLQI